VTLRGFGPFLLTTEKVMVKLTTLVRPSGKEIDVNENSLPHCLKMGWVRKVPKTKKKAKKAE